jgi:Mu transposase, C-terminal
MAPRVSWLGDGWLPRIPESLEALDLLLIQVAKARLVHRDCIHFQRIRYRAPTLAAYVGEAVTIRYDPRDLAEVRVFHEKRFLCRAISPEHSGETISLKDIQAARATHAARCAVKSLREPGRRLNSYLDPIDTKGRHPLRRRRGLRPSCRRWGSIAKTLKSCVQRFRVALVGSLPRKSIGASSAPRGFGRGDSLELRRAHAPRAAARYQTGRMPT